MRSEGSSRLRRISRRKLHMRVVGVKRALHWSPGQPSGSFLTQINCSRCGPCGVVGDATSVVQAQRQIHRVLAGHHTAGSQRTRFPIEIAALRYVSCGCVAIRGSSPFIDCGFDRRRTSHPVAVPRTAGTTIPHSQGHRAREGGSTLYFGISQPLFATVRPPGSNGADQARGGTRDNDSGPAKYLSLPS